jgi:hypothetical protein
MSKDKKRDKWIYDAMVHLAKIHGDSEIEGYEGWAENLADTYYSDSAGLYTPEQAVDEDLSYL